MKNQERQIIFTDINLKTYNPYYFCQNSVFTDQYSTCINHGDLNTENIIIDSAKGNWYLIDYAHTGRGHVFLDFISLELSLRHSIFWNNNNMSFSISELQKFENTIIDAFKPKEYPQKNHDGKSYWIMKTDRLIRLIRHQALKNFPDEPEKLYLFGLFYMALGWTTYHIKLNEKRYFILLAGLLAEFIDALNAK